MNDFVLFVEPRVASNVSSCENFFQRQLFRQLFCEIFVEAERVHVVNQIIQQINLVDVLDVVESNGHIRAAVQRAFSDFVKCFLEKPVISVVATEKPPHSEHQKPRLLFIIARVYED